MEELKIHEEAYTTYEPLDELCSRHHPKNPKDHDIGSLIESIQEFGFVRNVMVNETDGLIGNHFEICWSRTSHRRRMIRHHWSGVNARNKDMSRSHPTEKSVDVIAEIIEDYTEANMIIVDLFLGSGTTMVAAEQLNRICCGMEIHPPYCSVVLERMSGMGLTPKLVQRIEVSS